MGKLERERRLELRGEVKSVIFLTPGLIYIKSYYCNFRNRFAVLDYGTNYCNLRNLVDGAGWVVGK